MSDPKDASTVRKGQGRGNGHGRGNTLGRGNPPGRGNNRPKLNRPPLDNMPLDYQRMTSMISPVPLPFNAKDDGNDTDEDAAMRQLTDDEGASDSDSSKSDFP